MRNNEENFRALLERGDAAAAAGTPLVAAWPRMRAHLQLASILCGDHVTLNGFEARFPARFAGLPDAAKQRCPSRHAYDAMRREIPKVLAVVGVHFGDGWVALRTLARALGDERAFHELRPLAKAARSAGRDPGDVDAVWAIAHDRGLRGNARNMFRRGAVAFDRLRGLGIVVASGLLPGAPIGGFPFYDRAGRVVEPLPPRLSALCSGLGDANEKSSVRCLWRGVRLHGGLGLPTDPSADDLLAGWDRIAPLDGAKALGIKRKSFLFQRSAARRVFVRHAAGPVPDQAYDRKGRRLDPLPPTLSAIAEGASSPARTSLRAIWRAVCSVSGFRSPPDPLADDLLAIWGQIEALPAVAVEVKEITWRCYLAAARCALEQRSTKEPPPRIYRDKCGRPIAPLPPRLAAICAAQPPSSAERKALRLVWRLALGVGDLELPQDPSADDLLAVWPKIASVDAVTAGFAESTLSVSRAKAKVVLTTAATPQGIETNLEEEPLRGASPAAEPARWSAEFDDVAALMGYAQSTRRALRAVLARGFAKADGTGRADPGTDLAELIALLENEAQFADRPAPDLARLPFALRLAAHPTWRALQDAVRRAGVPLARNPTLALFAMAGDAHESVDLTRDWAWRAERGLRPDLRLTLAANVERLDALHDIPALATCGLLPSERLGPLPPRGGRHAHAVYPLPRPVKTAIAGLPCETRPAVEGAAFFFWRHARDAGLYGPADAPGPCALFAEANLARILAAIPIEAHVGAGIVRAHVRAVAALLPALDTPKAAWERVFAAARDRGVSPSALVPLYALKAAALLDGLGPSDLTRQWALSVLEALPRATLNTLNRGLRVFDAIAIAAQNATPFVPIGDGRPVTL